MGVHLGCLGWLQVCLSGMLAQRCRLCLEARHFHRQAAAGRLWADHLGHVNQVPCLGARPLAKDGPRQDGKEREEHRGAKLATWGGTSRLRGLSLKDS